MAQTEDNAIFSKFDFASSPAYNWDTGLIYTIPGNSISGNTANATLLGGKVFSWLSCPSSPLPQFVMTQSNPPANGVGLTSSTYTAIAGAISDRTNVNWDGNTNINAATGQQSTGGVLVPLVNNPVVSIRDGTSSTLTVGEQSDFCFDPSTGQYIDCRSDFGHSLTMGANAEGLPGTPTDPRFFNGTTVRYAINDKNWLNRGVGEQYFGCNRPIQSAHPGGAHSATAGGSVHFLAESLDLQLLFNLSNKADGHVVSVDF
jgi:hypothetical protein